MYPNPDSRLWSQPEVQSFLPSSKIHPSIHEASAYPSNIKEGPVPKQARVEHSMTISLIELHLNSAISEFFRFGPQNLMSNEVAYMARL